MQGIYAITCIPTGDQYIGSARDIAKRWAQHKTGLRCGKHSSARLLAAWQLHGSKSFSWTVLETVEDVDMLAQTERDYIARLRPRLNANNMPFHLPDGWGIADRRTEGVNNPVRKAWYVMRQDESNKRVWYDAAGPFNSRHDAIVALEHAAVK